MIIHAMLSISTHTFENKGEHFRENDCVMMAMMMIHVCSLTCESIVLHCFICFFSIVGPLSGRGMNEASALL